MQSEYLVNNAEVQSSNSSLGRKKKKIVISYELCISLLIIFTCVPVKDPSVEDDILLEVVMLCGTFCLDEHCATLLVKAGLPDLLITILKG